MNFKMTIAACLGNLVAWGELAEQMTGEPCWTKFRFCGASWRMNFIPKVVLITGGAGAVMGSMAGYRGLPSCPSYSGAKAGIEAYGMALRAGLSAQNVHVSVVSPGYVATEMSDKLSGVKPFMITSERAAEIVRRGVVRNKARISFPFPLNLGARMVLPYFKFSVQR